MSNTHPAVTRSKAVSVDDATHSELERLSRMYGLSRRQIVGEAIAAFQAVRELQDAGRRRKETRPWNASDSHLVERRSR